MAASAARSEGEGPTGGRGGGAGATAEAAASSAAAAATLLGVPAPCCHAAAVLSRPLRTSSGVEEVKIKNKRECAITELLEGQILAENIEAQEGVILLRRGTYLSKDMIARLRELAAETNPGQMVWIGELSN